ncbi:DUF1028 domain-containing protein [Phyllobacterium chamaecytisi]|uniref:DUF1028 domain-containing protein n=1 Tax=Phyllobacterium chamaecytisi TaxID=2876082 RepID=UPI001CCCF06A|nr:DUF1028 domain-containing protein [Phyllobacterium sp. KW56]MBZ9603599.1 DUF1028 domain-containing protein [Phyllobacterium sp. KW56]
MTFSIAARCPHSGMLGIAISSSSPAVAARCAHAKAGIGVVASQNVTDPALGQRGLALMERGLSARAALADLLSGYPTAEWRQLAIVDRHGKTAVFSGERTLGVHAAVEGDNAVAAGNLLASKLVPQRMLEALQASSGHLGDRLLAAMAAGLAAGGEAGPVHSAGLYLVQDVSWPVADLRVDWTDGCPIEELSALWGIYKPQIEDYVRRAIDPTAAPSYGVPGDE